MENAHRISNLCYPRGSVVYAKFEKNSDYYYMNMRPLIVVSNQMQMFDTLSVIGCGSKDRPGIEISLFNHRLGQWIGDHEYSIAQPYSVYTITTNQIQEFHGVIDVWTMTAIDKAMAFHLGLTDEVPPYMELIWNELLQPKYRMGSESNTQLKDPHQFGAVSENTRKFARIPSVYSKSRDIGETYTVVKERENSTAIVEPITQITEPTNVNTEEVKVEKEKTEYTLPDITVSEDKPVRQGTAELIIPDPSDEATVEQISDGILHIINCLTEEEKIKSITRKLKPGTYGTITIYANQISQIRKAIEITYGLSSGEFGKKLAGRICHQQRNFRFLTKFERCAAVLYSSSRDLQITNAMYNEVAKQVIKEYHLKFDDGRSWRNFDNFGTLRALTGK